MRLRRWSSRGGAAPSDDRDLSGASSRCHFRLVRCSRRRAFPPHNRAARTREGVAAAATLIEMIKG